MLVDSDRLVPITRLQKELTRTVREVAESGEPVVIQKNNELEAVLMPFETYRRLADIDEMLEYLEIGDMVAERSALYDPKAAIPWSELKG